MGEALARARALLLAALATLALANADDARRFDSPPRSFDFLDMHLELTLTSEDIAARRMRGIVTYSIQPRDPASGPTELPLDAVDLQVRSVRDATIGGDLSFRGEAGKLLIDVHDAYDSDGHLTVQIVYSVEQPRRGLFFVLPDAEDRDAPPTIYSNSEPLQARYWLPCHDWPDTRWPADVRITVPQSLFAVSVGALVEPPRRVPPAPASRPSTQPAEPLWTFHWRLDQPIDPHLLGFAVGRFEMLRFDSPPWISAEPGASGTLPPVFAYVEKEHESAARYTFRRTPQMVHYYSELLGVRFPFPQFAHVSVREHFHGGMEHAGFSMLAPANLTAGPGEGSHEDYYEHCYIAHMLAHSWFGGLVNYRHVREAWLNEGFATYLHQLWYTQSDGEDAFRQDLWQTARTVVRGQKLTPAQPLEVRSLRSPGEVYSFGHGLVYWKGAWVVHMLRRQLGEEVFWNAVRAYLLRRDGSVETADLQKDFEAISGQDLAPFFDQWVRRPDVPELSVKYAWDEERRLARVTVQQTQAAGDEHPPLTFPLDLYFRTEAGGRIETITIDSAETALEFPFPQPPAVFCVDPDNWLLKSLTAEMPDELWRAQVRGGPTALTRALAVQHLQDTAATAVAEADLCAALLDRLEFWGVRRRVAALLGGSGTPTARETLLAVAASDAEDPRVLTSVTEALGRIADSAAAPLVPVH